MNKKYLIIIGVALAVVVGAVVVTSSVKAEENGESTLSQVVQNLRDLKDVLTELRGLGDIDQAEEPSFGSVVGPDSFFPVYNANGVRTWPLRQSFTNGTGTVAVVQSPADATTTLAFRINVAIATGTATIIEVSTSTNAVSTSSVNRLGSLTLASGARGTLIGTSTNFCFGGTTCSYNVGNGLSTTTVTNFARLTDIEIAPSTYVVVRVGAEYGGSANIVGNTFTTVFTEI